MTSQVVTLIGVGETQATMRLHCRGRQTLGRNVQALNCCHKRISREHAYIEIDDDGKVWLTAAHINPCYVHEKAGTKTLKKGVKACLDDGSRFSFLPNQFIYQVSIKNEPIKETGNSKRKEGVKRKEVIKRKEKRGNYIVLALRIQML